MKIKPLVWDSSDKNRHYVKTILGEFLIRAKPMFYREFDVIHRGKYDSYIGSPHKSVKTAKRAVRRYYKAQIESVVK